MWKQSNYSLFVLPLSENPFPQPHPESARKRAACVAQKQQSLLPLPPLPTATAPPVQDTQKRHWQGEQSPLDPQAYAESDPLHWYTRKQEDLFDKQSYLSVM